MKSPDTITSDELIEPRLRERIAAYTRVLDGSIRPTAAHLESARNELREAADLIARLSADKARMAGDWIEWHGGDCPCPGALVIYKTDNGTPDGWVHAGTHWLAENLNWSGDRGRSQIIAYKIVKPAASPPNMEELREALKPFAEAADSLRDSVHDLKFTHGWAFQARDFRRARAALQNASTTP